MPKSIPSPFSQKAVDHFWARVDTSGGPDACWPIRGCRNGSGYGSATLGGRPLGSHVVAYLITYGSVPPGHDVCHTCDNPPCCNPAHLFTGTRFDNMADCAAKGRNGSQRYPERRPRGDRHFARTNPEKLARGEKASAGKGKLTAEQVREIRRLSSTGTSQSVLGLRFGVSQTQIGKIVRRERWAWLDDEPIVAMAGMADA